MPLLRDFRAARRMFRNALRSRRNRREIAERLEGGGFPDLSDSGIEIAVYFADTRVNLYQIRQWYAPLAELARTGTNGRLGRNWACFQLVTRW